MKQKIIYILLIIFSQFSIVVKADNITIIGTVVDTNNNPISGASILIDGSSQRGATGSDGKFTITAPEYGKILITCIGFENHEERIIGRKEIKIVMKSSNTMLPEVTITSMLDKNMKFIFEPSELEVVKNQLLLKTRYKVPAKRFHKDSRLIVQPYLVNYTQNKRTQFTPIVYDGRNYDILIKRGHTCGDPNEKIYYSKYAQVIDKFDSKEMITYTDSCQVDNINDRYATEIRIKISTFCQDEYTDSVIIARGVVYPMRFFDFNTSSFELDDSYAPEQEVLKFNEKGEMQLHFRPSEFKIYETDGQNGKELNKFRKILQDIETDTTKNLSFFSIMGYTSPEGSYKMNEKLSKQRVKSAIDAILKKMTQKTLSQANIKYDGMVVPWDSIYSQMQKDNLQEEAEELNLLIRRARKNHDEISWGAKRLKCYPIIKDKYLPHFRKVEYAYEYTERRTLNVKEITELYNQNPKNLTASEFWRYVRSRQNASDSIKEQLMREALHYHPDLMVAANNLSALLNKLHKADTTLLKPFLIENAPLEIKINQVISLLQTRDFKQADLLANTLPNTPNTKEVKAIISAMNGQYQEAYEYFKHKDCINKAILLLCLHQNQEAWQCMQNTQDISANAEYVRAIAANRLNDIQNAIIHIQKALSLNPELKKIMEIDGDVLDLMDFIK